MSDSHSDSRLPRRDFLRGASAAALGSSGLAVAGGGNVAAGSPSEGGMARAAEANPSTGLAPDTPYPKLAILTPYSRPKLAFATAAGYEGVVIPLDKFFDPDKLSDSQIDDILATSRETGAHIISIECMWGGLNHIDPNPAARAEAQARFIRCLEFAHRLGCKFCGTFSGGIPGADIDRQVKELAAVVNEKYVPVLDKLDVSMGWENYPTEVNFATVPDAWEKVFDLVPSPRLGLEFDPSHLVRQFIDPYEAAWRVRDRIRAGHLKDTEITQAVLQRVGIHGQGWWRYRIPGQGLIDWPKFITVLLQAKFQGGVAVEHEDPFWDTPHTASEPDFPQTRKDGFILAHRFLRQFLPGRMS
jgi:sugar phosphate isomerase/epimerase